MLRFFIILSLLLPAASAHAERSFRPVQCERSSIVPADLLLTYGSSGATYSLVLDEHIQIQELLSEFSSHQPNGPLTEQVYKIEFDFIDDPTQNWDGCVTSNYRFLMKCLGNGQLRFIGTQNQELARYNAGLILDSEFTSNEYLFSDGQISRSATVKTKLQFLAIEFTLTAKAIDLEFDAIGCRYP